MSSEFEGVLPVNKKEGSFSFDLIRLLRKITGIKKIGHSGTLDPFAGGVMLLLIGRNYTKMSDRFLQEDKQYHATITLGYTTPTFDSESEKTFVAKPNFSLEELEKLLAGFSKGYWQTPPMFSAKKIGGKKLYELARKGITIERKPTFVNLSISSYHLDKTTLELDINCSKGTYIRSLADDIGTALGCGGYLSALKRTRSGKISINQCIDQTILENSPSLLSSFLLDYDCL